VNLGTATLSRIRSVAGPHLLLTSLNDASDVLTPVASRAFVDREEGRPAGWGDVYEAIVDTLEIGTAPAAIEGHDAAGLSRGLGGETFSPLVLAESIDTVAIGEAGFRDTANGPNARPKGIEESAGRACARVCTGLDTALIPPAVEGTESQIHALIPGGAMEAFINEARHDLLRCDQERSTTLRLAERANLFWVCLTGHLATGEILGSLGRVEARTFIGQCTGQHGLTGRCALVDLTLSRACRQRLWNGCVGSTNDARVTDGEPTISLTETRVCDQGGVSAGRPIGV